MAADYDSELPTSKDKVRLLIGDTVSPYTFQDEELAYFITTHGDRLYGAAAMALDAWMVKIGTKPSSYTRGGISVSRSASDIGRLADIYRSYDSGDILEELTEFAYDHFSLQRIIADKALQGEI